MSDEANAASNAAPSDIAQVSDAGQAAPAAEVTASADKPAGSAREALERAFKTVDGGEQQAGRERGPDGKFVAKQPAQAEQPTQVTTNQTTADALAAEQAAKDAAAAAAQAIAHPGLTKEAQALWNTAPEALRNDVMRRVTELTQGMEKYKGEAETHIAALREFEPVRKFADMAKQHGTTLEQALTNYTGIEDVILANPVAGLLQICRNMNLNPQAIGHALAGMTPDQASQMMPQQRPQPAQTPAEVKALQERIDRLESQTQAQKVEQVVNNFASEKDAEGNLKHPYFEELAADISRMLETGFAKDLAEAYANAARLNPAVAERIAKDKAAKEAAIKTAHADPAQTREKAAKSITGSPSTASNASARKPAGSAREALSNAFAQVGLN